MRAGCAAVPRPTRSHALATAAFLAVSFVVAACTSAPSPLSDPREILQRAVAHLGSASSAHLDVSVDGSITLGSLLGGPAASGGALALTGTHVEGDLDLQGERAALRFQVPALLGLTGEVRQVGGDTYLQSSLTSRGWHALTGTDLPFAIERPLEWIDGLTAWLGRPTTVPSRLDDASCRAGTCYVIRVAADAPDLAALASAAPGLASSLAGDVVSVDLKIDRVSLSLSEALVHVDLGGTGSLAISMVFTAWDAAVRIEAPPASEIVAGPLLP